MPSVRRFKLVPVFIRFLKLHAGTLTPDTLMVRTGLLLLLLLLLGWASTPPLTLLRARTHTQAACEALSIIFDTDDFQTNEDRYLPNEAVGDMLASLGDDFITDMASENSDLRRRIRPLLDEIRNHK